MLRHAITSAVNTKIGFALIRRLTKPTGLFLCYPVEQRFADHFCTLARQARITWQPYLVGWMKQGEALSLLFTIAATETELLEPRNTRQLSDIHSRMMHLQKYFSADQLSYAGILPTVMRARRIIRTSTEADLTCIAIRDAILKVISSQPSYPGSITVLGGRGFVGRRMVTLLKSDHDIPVVLRHNVTIVDKGDPISARSPSLFLNCSLPGVIDTIAHQIPMGSVVLNEVYPAPGPDTINLLTSRGISVYHVAGVCGTSKPNFPGEYSGAIPCCAAIQNLPVKVVIKTLTSSDA